MTSPKDPTTYLIEGLRTFTRADYRPDRMTERTVQAWELLDTVESTANMYVLFGEWFDELPDDEKIAGRYRVVNPAAGYFYEYVASPSWKVEDAKRGDSRPPLSAVGGAA